jgi:hypothetical protein
MEDIIVETVYKDMLWISCLIKTIKTFAGTHGHETAVFNNRSFSIGLRIKPKNS